MHSWLTFLNPYTQPHFPQEDGLETLNIDDIFFMFKTQNSYTRRGDTVKTHHALLYGDQNDFARRYNEADTNTYVRSTYFPPHPNISQTTSSPIYRTDYPSLVQFTECTSHDQCQNVYHNIPLSDRSSRDLEPVVVNAIHHMLAAQRIFDSVYGLPFLCDLDTDYDQWTAIPNYPRTAGVFRHNIKWKPRPIWMADSELWDRLRTELQYVETAVYADQSTLPSRDSNLPIDLTDESYDKLNIIESLLERYCSTTNYTGTTFLSDLLELNGSEEYLRNSLIVWMKTMLNRSVFVLSVTEEFSRSINATLDNSDNLEVRRRQWRSDLPSALYLTSPEMATLIASVANRAQTEVGGHFDWGAYGFSVSLHDQSILVVLNHPRLNRLLLDSTLNPTLDVNTLDFSDYRERVKSIYRYNIKVDEVLPYNFTEVGKATYGVELELCCELSPERIGSAQGEKPFFIAKKDASISGQGSLYAEAVTVPMSLKNQKIMWGKFFENVQYEDFDTSANTGNGMHVHIGKKAFSKSHLRRFLAFFHNPGNCDFNFLISERPHKKDFLRWAPMVFHNSTSQSVLWTIKNAGQANFETIRHIAHCKNRDTVEIRMFKGLVSYATVIKNLEYVDSIRLFSEQTLSISKMTVDHYLKWLNSQPKNRYKLIREFINQIDKRIIKKLVCQSDILSHVGETTSRQVMVKRLNSRIVIRPEHIAFLNKLVKVKAFIEKDGKLVCINGGAARLSSLDKNLSKQFSKASTPNVRIG